MTTLFAVGTIAAILLAAYLSIAMYLGVTP